MSINGGSHPRINTLGRMARAESGTDLRYEMSSHVVGGGGGGGGTHTHKTYYYQKTYGGDYASDGYGYVGAGVGVGGAVGERAPPAPLPRARLGRAAVRRWRLELASLPSPPREDQPLKGFLKCK